MECKKLIVRKYRKLKKNEKRQATDRKGGNENGRARDRCPQDPPCHILQ